MAVIRNLGLTAKTMEITTDLQAREWHGQTALYKGQLGALERSKMEVEGASQETKRMTSIRAIRSL